jgi:hypothetical protein
MQTITNALYDLLSNPEYIEPLRHDVETAVAEEGWTKAAIDKMHKIDSFLRESLRINAPGFCPLVTLIETQFTDVQLVLSSVTIPRRITSIHIFQWSHCSCGYVNRYPIFCCPQWMETSIQTPRNLMASALRSSMRVMELV